VTDSILAAGFASAAPVIASDENHNMTPQYEMIFIASGLLIAGGFLMSAIMGYGEFLHCEELIPLLENKDG